MIKKLILIIILGTIIGLPFIFFKPKMLSFGSAEDRLVILTSNTNAIRDEMDKGFKEWYKEKTGRNIAVEWRNPGGTSENFKYLDSIYLNSFRLYWENVLGYTWNAKVSRAYNNPFVVIDDTPEDDTLEQRARRAFLNSKVGYDVDVSFGGGLIHFIMQTDKGYLVSYDIYKTRPEIFNDEIFPMSLAGSPLYDEEGRWYGTTFATYGIVYNEALLDELGFENKPSSWDDLANPLFYESVAISDPGVSGSMNTTYEMIIQYKMHTIHEQLKLNTKRINSIQMEEEAKNLGWEAGLQLLQRCSGNARFFRDNAVKTILDVASGNCTIGVAIDYYAFTHSRNLYDRNESLRLKFVLPKGATAPQPDCVGLLRGAPNQKEAEMFIDYAISMDAQKLSAFSRDTPGGPVRYELCRPSIRKDFYTTTKPEYRYDPELNPFDASEGFTYRKDWTGDLYSVLKFVFKAAFINPHDELKRAWGAIIKAEKESRYEDAKKATEIFDDLSAISYANCAGYIKSTLDTHDPLSQIELEAKLTKHFTEKYRKVEELANGLY